VGFFAAKRPLSATPKQGRRALPHEPHPAAAPPPSPQGGGSWREPVLRLTGITKRFGALTANDAISFDLFPGQVIALLGENGAGKTTLMNILFGHYVADEGSIEAFGKPLPAGDPKAALAAGIGMVHQHFTLAENLSVLENIALGTQSPFSLRLDRDKVRRRIAALAADFGLAVAIDAPVHTLSVGERQRVEILKALYRDARVLILDEPTAVLTPIETDALFLSLRKFVASGLSVIFISHKLNEVMAISQRVLVLRSGRVAGERATAETTRQDLAELMVGREVTPPTVEPANLGETVLELAYVDAELPESRVKLDNVWLRLLAGEIVGIAGVSGNGQGVLAALLSGQIKPSSGTMAVRGQAIGEWSPRAAIQQGIGRIPEDRHAVGTIADMTLTENAISERYRERRFGRNGLLDWRAARRFAEDIIRDYDIKTPSADTRIRLLSGGNMQKLILGRALDASPSIILANQPARGLDVGAVAYVHGRLLEARARGAAIVLISDDLDEILALSDRIIVMSNGRLSTASARGERSPRELGELMAGHDAQEAATDAP